MLKYLLNFLYPSRCLYCAKTLEDPFALLCLTCIPTLHLSHHHYGEINIYCFEMHSAASSLLKTFEETTFSKLKELIISFMVVQYFKCHDSIPDWVIPSLNQDCLGQNTVSHALAKAFSQKISSNFINAFKLYLKPSIYDAQGNLEAELRLNHKALKVMKKEQSILILSDYYKKPQEHREALLKQGYEHVYYLSVIFKETV